MNGKRSRFIAGLMVLLYVLALSHALWEGGTHNHSTCALCHLIDTVAVAVLFTAFGRFCAGYRYALPPSTPFQRTRYRKPLLRAPPVFSLSTY
jgi:hypothetical protein